MQLSIPKEDPSGFFTTTTTTTTTLILLLLFFVAICFASRSHYVTTRVCPSVCMYEWTRTHFYFIYNYITFGSVLCSAIGKAHASWSVGFRFETGCTYLFFFPPHIFFLLLCFFPRFFLFPYFCYIFTKKYSVWFYSFYKKTLL